MNIPLARAARTFLAAFVASAVVLATTARADPARELTWDDLLPAKVIELSDQTIEIRKELRSLSREQRDKYRDVAQELYLRDQIEQGFVTKADLSGDAQALLDAAPSKGMPAAVAYWERLDAKRKELDAVTNTVDASLEGQRIRMPGYMLPLDFEGTLVREFLLVPYLGACIHSPPPPPNQIVHVKSDKGFASEELYTPVWIEGTMNLDTTVSNLTYIDGSARINAGYAVSDAKVEPYTE